MSEDMDRCEDFTLDDDAAVTTIYAVQSCSCGKVRRVAVAKKDRWANRGR